MKRTQLFHLARPTVRRFASDGRCLPTLVSNRVCRLIQVNGARIPLTIFSTLEFAVPILAKPPKSGDNHSATGTTRLSMM